MRSGIGNQGREVRPYRKYRPLPALLLISLLGVFSLFVWLKAINGSNDINEAVRCDPPATPPPGMTYTSVGYTALDGIDPIPPNKIAVRVLNAGGARGQAAITTEALRHLGFSEIGKPANDPAYEDRTANCRGQIRYGENGASAARTLSLVDPCVELIKDSRKDASVDFAIGTAFTDVLPPQESREVLQRLSSWAKDRSGTGDSELATGENGPQIDDSLLSAAREANC